MAGAEVGPSDGACAKAEAGRWMVKRILGTELKRSVGYDLVHRRLRFGR